MIRYKVQGGQPHHRFINFVALFPSMGEYTTIQLPVWRPGRYELGNFAKNVRGWKAYDADTGELLLWKKSTPHTWVVESDGVDYIKVHYEYFAAEMNAGSSYWDGAQLYINPVNAFCFLLDDPEMNLDVQIHVPHDFDYAGGIPSERKQTENGESIWRLVAANIDHLADSPFVFSRDLSSHDYDAHGQKMHVWMNGEVNFGDFDWRKDFQAFSELQMSMFGDFPRSHYHFIFQFAPYFIRHGVEHENSTIIAMGPSQAFNERKNYDSFLGISSHELFHAWNVKCIRPKDMTPYDFTKPNYSDTGFITEGVTTYYGDMMLIRSGVWSMAKAKIQMEEFIETHARNRGRLHQSVTDSSVDTWVDGYTAGIPGRKVSIYNEGAMLAWMMDVDLLVGSQGKVSLDDVMREMYKRFGKRGVGYTSDDYWNICKELGLNRWESYRYELCEGTGDYLAQLKYTLKHLGWKLEWASSGNVAEDYYGFLVDDMGRVINVVFEGPADDVGIGQEMRITCINGQDVHRNAKEIMQKQTGDLTITVEDKWREYNVEVLRREKPFKRKAVLVDIENSDLRQIWSGSRLGA